MYKYSTYPSPHLNRGTFCSLDLEEWFTLDVRESSSTTSWLTFAGEQTHCCQVQLQAWAQHVSSCHHRVGFLSDVLLLFSRRRTASLLNDSSDTGVKVWRDSCDWWIRRKPDYDSNGLGNSIITLGLFPCLSASSFVYLQLFYPCSL